MKFIPLEIPDVILIEPSLVEDSRGFFYESYREDVFSRNGIGVRFVQDNHSRSARGVLRGLHYQIPPKAQAKLIRVTQGEIFDVAVDIRKASSTFGKSVVVHLSDRDKKMLYIPAGFAHGFCTLQDGTEVLYKTSEFYSPTHERGILWSDPDLAIPWPKLGAEYSLSPKDSAFPAFKKACALNHIFP